MWWNMVSFQSKLVWSELQISDDILLEQNVYNERVGSGGGGEGLWLKPLFSTCRLFLVKSMPVPK